VDDGDGRNHRVAAANWLAGAVQIAGDLPCQVSSSLVE